MLTRPKHGALLPILLLPIMSIADDNAAMTKIQADTGERQPVHTVVPLYPEKARMARVEGDVEVCFNVDRNGMTSRVAVRRSTNRIFEKSARNAVRDSTYRPLLPGQSLSGIKSCRTFHFILTPVEIDTLEN